MKQKVPKYIQRSIKRMFYHKKVVENNTKIVDNYLKHNNIDRSIALNDLVDLSPKKQSLIADGQMSIFDILGRNQQ